MRRHHQQAARLAAAAAALLALALLPAAAAHGFIVQPAARNYVRNWQYCPHCVNNGGPGASSNGSQLMWPASTAPACGAPDLMGAGPVVRSYPPGSVIDLTVFFSTQHGGRHVFRLCPAHAASKDCFARPGATLLRADGSGPYSWTPTKDRPVPGAAFRWGSLPIHDSTPIFGSFYTWRYKLPPTLACPRCVLQWWWTTGNSCRVPGAPAWVGSDTSMPLCTSAGTFPEEFLNCADIRVALSPPSPPRPPPLPPRPPPRPRPPQPRPRPPRPPRPRPRPPQPPPQPRPPPRPPPRPRPPPSPPAPPPSPCNQASAIAFCNRQNRQVDRFYANVVAGCTCFFRCGPGGSSFGSCKSPLLFNDQRQYCDWPANVQCRVAGG